MMSPSIDQKKEHSVRHLVVLRGARYAERPARTFTEAELELDQEMAIIVGAVRGADRSPPSRGFQRASWGEAKPWRVLARWFVAAHRVGAPREQVMAIALRLVRFVDVLYSRPGDKAA